MPGVTRQSYARICISIMHETNFAISSGTLLDGRYKLLRPLSSDGGTADVWLALDNNTIDEVYDEDNDRMSSEEESGIKVAIKIYRPKNALDFGEQRFREEFKIVFNCHHTNLVQPINFSIYEGIPYLVLPYCRNGSSESLLGKINNADELWRYISDVSAGLKYLHAYNPTIVHHDIKPANVLVDDNCNYAITDFGISSHRGLNREGYDDTQSGTMAYMAPERFREDYESMPESDIWSFGATLYEIVTGKVPFGENGGLVQLQKGASCAPISAPIPSDIKKLIYDCLSSDTSKRPSAAVINRAAEAASYPLKNKKWYYIGGTLLLIVLLVVLALLLMQKGSEPLPEIVQPTDHERFQHAMSLVDAPGYDNLSKGISILDTLSAKGYVPALYEKAYIYGWYSDSASLARKDLLGIEYYPEESEQRYFPKEKQINIKAIGLLTKIEEIGDDGYPEINANALYRLACYYVNENNVFQKDFDRAKILLTRAEEWAERSNNPELLDKIRRNLAELQE